jgi:uncharacterized cupredoxin-like copper-binding protein
MVTSSQPGGAPASPSGGAPRISRAPVIVTILFFAVAVTLVVIGAQLSLQPAPSFAIDEPGTGARPRPINVIMRDYRFDPTPVVLVPGETVRITVFNAGLVDHEMVLGDAAVQSAWHAADAAATPPGLFQTAPPASVPAGTGGLRVLLSSGKQQIVEYTVPASGELALICHLPGHIERGMVGAVELRTTIGPVGSGRPAPSPASTNAG